MGVATQLQWAPNRYAYAVGKNVLIAAIGLGVSYEALTYFAPTMLPTRSATTEKAHSDRQSLHKAKQGSASEEQITKLNSERQQPPTTLPSGTTAFVSDNNVIIRESPKLSSKILGRAIFGTSIEALAFDGKWVQIHSSAQNLSGWTEKTRLNF